MRIIVLIAVVAGLIGLVGGLQALSRAAQLTATEAHLRPLAAVGRAVRASQPPELTQLETVVADALRGDRAATVRLAARLAARGVVLGDEPTPAQVISALQDLQPLEDPR